MFLTKLYFVLSSFRVFAAASPWCVALVCSSVPLFTVMEPVTDDHCLAIPVNDMLQNGYILVLSLLLSLLARILTLVEASRKLFDYLMYVDIIGLTK